MRKRADLPPDLAPPDVVTEEFLEELLDVPETPPNHQQDQPGDLPAEPFLRRS